MHSHYSFYLATLLAGTVEALPGTQGGRVGRRAAAAGVQFGEFLAETPILGPQETLGGVPTRSRFTNKRFTN